MNTVSFEAFKIYRERRAIRSGRLPFDSTAVAVGDSPRPAGGLPYLQEVLDARQVAHRRRMLKHLLGMVR